VVGERGIAVVSRKGRAFTGGICGLLFDHIRTGWVSEKGQVVL